MFTQRPNKHVRFWNRRPTCHAFPGPRLLLASASASAHFGTLVLVEPRGRRRHAQELLFVPSILLDLISVDVIGLYCGFSLVGLSLIQAISHLLTKSEHFLQQPHQ
jgi:hypothetical protein